MYRSKAAQGVREFRLKRGKKMNLLKRRVVNLTGDSGLSSATHCLPNVEIQSTARVFAGLAREIRTAGESRACKVRTNNGGWWTSARGEGVKGPPARTSRARIRSTTRPRNATAATRLNRRQSDAPSRLETAALPLPVPENCASLPLSVSFSFSFPLFPSTSRRRPWVSPTARQVHLFPRCLPLALAYRCKPVTGRATERDAGGPPMSRRNPAPPRGNLSVHSIAEKVSYAVARSRVGGKKKSRLCDILVNKRQIQK